ncbi:hypothetical protein CHARACLAT_007925 [Characodon lateralis]|uniref:Secreted protein n=1 Tax=Characodon lateralis TaxID=208331 RepID=A0ABU7DYN5_9TELE|nr:hypothetical protein [Characodon lateralis]
MSSQQTALAVLCQLSSVLIGYVTSQSQSLDAPNGSGFIYIFFPCFEIKYNIYFYLSANISFEVNRVGSCCSDLNSLCRACQYPKVLEARPVLKKSLLTDTCLVARLVYSG